MARRVLGAVALLALGIAGAASAGLMSRSAVDPPAPSNPCAASTSTAASTAITTVGLSGTTTVIPVGPVQPTGAPGSLCKTATATTTAVPLTTASTSTVTTSAASSTLVITGHGWGHGMGMGQWGAYGYALHGWSYTRILRHYYQGTTIATGSSPTVRVLLADRKRRVTLDSASPWKAVDRNGTTVDLPAGRLVVPASLELAGRTLSAPVTFEPGATPLEVGSVAYRGKLVVTSTGARMQLVNAVNLEAYIEGVVGAEMPNYWPQAALEAQAVAARTYALSELSNVVTANTFDLYDDTRSQVYSGIAAETPSIARAVAATARRVVLYRGKVATTYFSSSTGGETVSAAEALGTPIPYLVSVADPYDTLSPNHDWGPVLMSTRSVGKALGLGGPVDDLATEAASSGHIARVTASGLDTQQTMSGTHIEYELGLRSSWFEFAWLTLTPPAGPVVSGAQVTLTGTVRGLKDVSLEARAKGGTWALLGPVKPDATGRFTIRVSPSVTTSYRLATGTIRGALVSVAVTN